jgi:hypothetical protein
MSTALIEIKDDIAYDFLYQLERMKVLHIVNRQHAKHGNGQRLSQRFAGALSSERVDELQKELVQMRNEWDRNI